MDAQQETSRVLDLKQLDLILSFVPNPGGAKVLRDQIVSGCRIVEAKEDEVEALHARVENQSTLLRVQLEELKTERESFRQQKDHEIEKLRAEQVKLENLAQTLGSQFQDLTSNAGHLSDKVDECQTAVAEKLQGFGKVISDRASEREKAVNVLNQSVKDLSASARKNAEDLSSMSDRCNVMATGMDSVKEDQKRIESSLKDGVTMQGMKGQVKPLIELANTSKQIIDGLPTVAFLNTKFENVARLAERLEHLQAQATELGQVNQDLKNQNEYLSTERDRANYFSEQARSQLEENEETLGQKDSKIEELQTARDDLLNRLTAANVQISQGKDARRRLDEVQHLLQTAESTRQELAEVKPKLQQAEQNVKEMEQKIANLQRRLDREKDLNGDCSAKLTQALSNNSGILLQKTKLEAECSQLREDLRQLRSQEAIDVQQQMKDQWAAVSEAMKEQLSEKRSHEETVRQLKDSWSSEKQALEGEISAKVSLIENHEQQLQTLRSRVSTLEPLRGQLDAANENTSRFQALLEQASSNLQLSEQRVAQFEEMVSGSAKKLEDLKAENGRLQESGESVSLQLRASNGTIERLQQECDAVNEALSTLRAQSVRIPEGTAGELSRVYYRAADELRDIPIVLDTNGELDTPQLAAELITLIDGYKWKHNLLKFLHSRPEGWFCLQQVMDGDRDLMANGGKCQNHDDCLSVKVVLPHGSSALKFIFSD
ncbi:hypothetical protein Focb16_v014395 [Fusarium oxysporum f. sp. cubense]|uniref:Uncharacterized protein n=1 Tax=Fusarium oxysporum f. sp. cubense TaxID=61366 RepID=A0A559KTM0_FUSOC|nr:hypothetical protein Focb16_v014395 [Fusarium oxysporum f. sp. cubense]